MNTVKQQEMTQSVMECVGGMSAKERKEFCAALLGKIAEGLDMKEMMPKMMMGMMSGGAGGATADKSAEETVKAGSAGPQMPCGPGDRDSGMSDMMLKTMMPHCIGMMMPGIDVEKRIEAAGSIVSALAEKGCAGLSDYEAARFRRALEEGLARPTASGPAAESAAQPGSYPARLRRFEKNASALSAAQPAVTKAFWDVHSAAVAPAALDTKMKELIALAISVAGSCDDCIAHHVFDALEAGASKQEIADALGVAILMGGGTSLVYATHAIEALDQFSTARKTG